MYLFGHKPAPADPGRASPPELASAPPGYFASCKATTLPNLAAWVRKLSAFSAP